MLARERIGGLQGIAAEPPTRFVVQEVPAGRYVLTGMRVLLPEHTRASYINKDPLPASFTVNEAEVVYLGELGLTRFPGVIHNLGPDTVRKRLLKLR